jgi:hypothetical protein
MARNSMQFTVLCFKQQSTALLGFADAFSYLLEIRPMMDRNDNSKKSIG